ncbi:MAG: hypothetical protein O7B35_07955 [Deltaproteobacteria bacterium]|nr:hypothetical protein [Deltaproteobacteria bacterium]
MDSSGSPARGASDGRATEPGAASLAAPIPAHPAAAISRTMPTPASESVADLMLLLRKVNPVPIVARGAAFAAENAPPILL